MAKSKEKRLQRKEEQNRVSQAMAAIAQANGLDDPLEPFPVFRKYNKNSIEADLFIKRGNKLDESTKNWAFALTKRNMQTKYYIQHFCSLFISSKKFCRYDQCSWGWDDKKKFEELADEAAWYLIAKSGDGVLLGYSHFRFDLEEGVEVLYWHDDNLT